MNFSTEDLRARFAALKPGKDAIEQKIAEHRAQYDAARADLAAQEKAKLDPLISAIREEEAKLTPIESEMAMISRALKGKTSAPKPKEEPAPAQASA